MKQNGLTVITEIAPGRGDALRTVLEGAKASDPFGSIVSLHYAAFVVLPEVEDHPSRLVMETNYDGELCKHLDELIAQGAALLDQIYRSCKRLSCRRCAEGSRQSKAVFP